MAEVYDYIIPTGTITVDAQTVQDEVIQEFKDTFGEDLVVTPETPQGALIVNETLARTALAENNASLANQINPNLAGGIFLDAILALTGSQRSPATSTTVSCNLTGVPGTLIAAGSQASETVNLKIFELVESVTLSSEGSAVGIFQSVEKGPISVAANTLTQIVSDVLGWETVNNPAAGNLGQTTQSDEAARTFRRNTLASQGSSLAEAIISAVLQVETVTSLSFRENVANTTEVKDGVTMVPHSIYLCVAGGTNVNVAEAIISKKSGGCNYNNGASSNPVSQVITEPFSGQVMTVKFDRPDLIPILIRVTVRIQTSIKDPEAVVKKAILDYAAGEIDGEAGFIVGEDVSCFELAGAINQEAPTLYVQNVETTLASAPLDFSNDEIPIAVWQQANTNESSITVIFA